jgi:hypothetical protein
VSICIAKNEYPTCTVFFRAARHAPAGLLPTGKHVLPPAPAAPGTRAEHLQCPLRRNIVKIYITKLQLLKKVIDNPGGFR